MRLDPQHATADDVRERAAIDRSVRYPVLFFFTSAAAWLFVATLLGFLSAVKLRVPTLWEGCEFITYGRLFPVHMNALLYGWAMQAGLGVMLWLTARLTRSECRNPVTLIAAGNVWNIAVALGVVAVWFGAGRSLPWLDFPGWVAPLLGLSYVLIVVWLFPMFHRARAGEIFVSELFLLGAAVWFPWIYFSANLVIGKGGSATMGAGANAWYMSNLMYFWFAPVALAATYYLIPKIAGRPIHSYVLARIGFWVLAVCAGWTGFQRFAGGPFPAWMPAVGGAAAIFALLAVLVTGWNFRETIKGREKLWEYSPSLRFTMFGALMFVIFAALNAFSSYFGVSKILQFSHFVVGLDTLAVYGFFSMTIFGAIYYIVPRLTGTEWPSGSLIRSHFWLSAYGIATVVVTMLVGGIAQGGAIQQWNLGFGRSVEIGNPWIVGRIVAWLLIAFSNLGFFYQLALMFLGRGRASDGPTLIHKKPGEAASAEAAAGLEPEGAGV
ncbi:MAG: cbb3-type cytochrome c oxidase subunit I [Verrucomicrobiae bacterium]|nr:cbb3-type cytochrome c oxidase subunit I [Verrucomicrobiae bacterium]